MQGNAQILHDMIVSCKLRLFEIVADQLGSEIRPRGPKGEARPLGAFIRAQLGQLDSPWAFNIYGARSPKLLLRL